MKNRNIFRFAALVFAVCMIGTSCNDWLDVKPKAEEDAEDLFSTPAGFKSALAGCYTAMTLPDLYGRELTYGMAGVLAQEWGSGHGIGQNDALYNNIMMYQYDKANVETLLDSVWSKMYYAVAQCNTLIEYTEKNCSVLNDLQYSVIRGEAFGLRAFMHAELFRLFGKVSAEPATQKALPYVRSTSVGVNAQLTNEVYYKYLLDDIDEALKLLEKDPVYTGENAEGIEDGYYTNRQYHMNYYAVLALKARMQLHMGDKPGALATANTVIAAQSDRRFRWITKDEADPSNSKLKDRTFSTEHIFALNIMELRDYIKGYFREGDNLLMSRLEFIEPFLSVDFRGKLFETYNGFSNMFGKFWQLEPVTANGVTTTPRKNRMPMIRLSEMYFIAAEAQLESNPAEALRLLNVVLDNRGMEDHNYDGSIADNPKALADTYLEQYQREFMGEGQLWYYHKRVGTKSIHAFNAKYILPIPVSEWEFGNVEPIE